MPNSFTKDPAGILDYQWDWTAWLTGGETISSATVTLPAGLTFDTTGGHPAGYTNTTTAVTAWIKGGSEDTTYTVVCQVVTSGGRTDERSIYIVVRNR